MNKKEISSSVRRATYVSGKAGRKQHFRLAAALSIILVSVSFGGCGIDRAAEMTQKTEASSISFSWWGNDVRHFYTMNAVDQFQEDNPDIQVNYRYSVWNGYEKRTKVYM